MGIHHIQGSMTGLLDQPLVVFVEVGDEVKSLRVDASKIVRCRLVQGSWCPQIGDFLGSLKGARSTRPIPPTFDFINFSSGFCKSRLWPEKLNIQEYFPAAPSGSGVQAVAGITLPGVVFMQRTADLMAEPLQLADTLG